jgi:hypothetical protein
VLLLLLLLAPYHFLIIRPPVRAKDASTTQGTVGFRVSGLQVKETNSQIFLSVFKSLGE